MEETSKMIDVNAIVKKLDFYLGKDIKLHITKKRKRDDYKPAWYNCHIISKEQEGVYKVEDGVLGSQFLFVEEIFSVEEVRNRDTTKRDKIKLLER